MRYRNPCTEERMDYNEEAGLISFPCLGSSKKPAGARSMGVRTCFVCSALWFTAATTLAAEPELLGADEVRELITGNSIQSRDVASNATFWVYFDPNGRRAALQDEGEYELPWR